MEIDKTLDDILSRASVYVCVCVMIFSRIGEYQAFYCLSPTKRKKKREQFYRACVRHCRITTNTLNEDVRNEKCLRDLLEHRFDPIGPVTGIHFNRFNRAFN